MGDDVSVRIGIDIQEIAPVARSLAEFGDRYAARLFTAGELARSDGPPRHRARALATCFAAKEAVLKLLGVDGVVPAMTEIELLVDDRLCGIVLHGRAAALAHDAGLGPLFASVAGTSRVVMAAVVADSSRG